MKNLFSTFVFFFTLSFGFSQNFTETKFNQLKASADIVVFGEVIQKESFWNSSGNLMFTSNLIRVYNTLKGEETIVVEVITNGGQIDYSIQKWSHSIQLQQEAKGYFFLKEVSGEMVREGNILRLTGQEGFIPSTSKKSNSITEAENDKVVEFDFDNIQILSDGAIKFDVLIRANVDGLEFGEGELYLKYPEEVFGSDVVAEENVVVSKSDVINSSNFTVAVEDDEENVFKVSVDGGCTPFSGQENSIPLSTAFQSFLLSELVIQDFSALGSISMDELKMQGKIYYYDKETGECLPFDDIIVPYPIDIEAVCNIASFSDAVVIGGISDTLKIRGTGFDTMMGTVEFPDADTGGLKLVSVISDDIMSWSDTLIEVLVPSDPFPAGSGIFQVRTAGGMVCPSPSPLDVCYSVASVHRSGGKTFRLHLGDVQGDSSVVFRPAPVISADTNIVNVIEKALCDWNAATGINASLGTVLETDSPNPEDSINHIFMAPSSFFPGSALAETIISTTVCQTIPPNIQVFDFTKDVDIAIRQTPPTGTSWYFSCDESPGSTQWDFYSVFIHELGHAFHLEHVLPDEKLLFWLLQPQEIKREITEKDRIGVVDVLEQGIVELPMGINCPTPVITKELCTTTSVLNLSKFKTIEVFPNPISDNKLNIQLELPSSETVEIVLSNIRGERILEQEKKLYVGGEHLTTIDLPQNLPSGIYFLQILVGQEVQVAKIIKP